MKGHSMEERESSSEIIEIAAKTALSTIPVGGALISLIWDSVEENALRKREEDWKQLIEERVRKLECTVNDLGNDESFTSALLIATEIAAKTAEKEKKKYLANAVANSVKTEVNENKMVIFLSLMDKYTSWHIRLLDYFRNPTLKGVKRSDHYMGSPIIPIRNLYPDICAEEGIVEKIVKDLQNDGVLRNGDFLNVTMTSDGMAASRTTKLGNEFLDYILN